MSLNDPRWGNQGNDGKRGDKGRDDNQGPPDLEEVFLDAKRYLTGIMGGKRGNGGGNAGGPQAPQLSPGQVNAGIILLIFLLLMGWLATGFYTVDASERGIVQRFGKWHETTVPGWHWHFPYPFETVTNVNLSGVRVAEVGYRNTSKNVELREALMLTDEENIINIQFAVQFILKNPEDFLFNNRNPEDSVRHVAETSMREIVGKSKMDYVLYEGREQVAASAHELMQNILDRYGTGILISKVTMQNAQPPEQVQSAFDDAVKANQDLERQRNEGEAYANSVVPIAKGNAARIMEEANGYRSRVVAQAEGDASRFDQIYAEFKNAPRVTRERLYLETMQHTLSSSSKILLDAQSGGNVLLMPLDQLFQQRGKQTNVPERNVMPDLSSISAQPAAPATQSQFGGAIDPRDRDALRNRGGR